MATKREQDTNAPDKSQEKVEAVKEVTLVVENQSPSVTEPPEQLIYIGPTIRKNGIGLRTNQVYLGGHPVHLKALYEEYPTIKTLFVPVDELQESLRKIKQTGTALNTALRSMEGV
ncbi:hypothetical protein NYE69_28365 [Paenibacillus sp. FSL R5-0527]|uniref:hypothetical protein n=1 Tax=Paenibacillus sp. FSL R5-0527 TaxID=2975321 RepID=UPI00097AD902|nr:hypothetical protein BK140_11040 [Paenibacillus macerans]